MIKSGKICLLYIVVTFSSLVLLQTSARAQVFSPQDKVFDWGQWQLAAQGNYLMTEGNYTGTNGEYIRLPNNYSYSLSQFDFAVRWVALPKLGLTAATQFAYAESNNGRDSRVNSSISEFSIGMDYQLLEKKDWDLFCELSTFLPTSRVDWQSDAVLNHEGSTNIRGGLALRYNLSQMQFFASSGYVYRDEERSHLLDYFVGTEIKFSSFFVGAGLEGFTSIAKDSRNNAVSREQVYAKNGNSLRFYSVDPNLISAKAWLAINAFNDWKLFTGIVNSLSGSAHSAGITIFAGLTWIPFSNSSPNIPIKKSTAPEESFSEDTSDGVDQHFFETVPSVTQPPQIEKDKKKAEPEIKIIPEPLKRPQLKPRKSRQQLKKELDQAEFQIELKTSKKKKRRK